MRAWKKKKPAVAEIKVKSTAAGAVPVDAETARRDAAKRARRIAARRSKRLVGAWSKATQGWKWEDAIPELESRVSKGIRAVMPAESGAKQARQAAGRRARRLITAWAKATHNWAWEDSLTELEARLAAAVRKAMG